MRRWLCEQRLDRVECRLLIRAVAAVLYTDTERQMLSSVACLEEQRL
jgi:hypothetical protein